jgi:hypothetical protein
LTNDSLLQLARELAARILIKLDRGH